MPRYVTADVVADVPTLADVPADQRQRALDDAATVLDWISANQWAMDGALRAEFEQRDWDPDRLNCALGVLRDTGHILTFEPRSQAILEVQQEAGSDPSPA